MNREGNPMVNIIIMVVFLVMVLLLTQVVSPGVIKSLGESDKLYSEENILQNAGIKYFDANEALLPEEIGDYVAVTAEDLIAGGYLEPITDKAGELCYFDISEVKVQKIGSYKYDYHPLLFCENYSTLETTDRYARQEATFSNLTEWLDTFIKIVITVIMFMLLIIGPPYGQKKYISLLVIAASFIAMYLNLYVWGISVVSEWIVIIANMSIFIWMNQNE